MSVQKHSGSGIYQLFQVNDMSSSGSLHASTGSPLFDKDGVLSFTYGHTKGVGLARSQSLPTEGWCKTRCEDIPRLSCTDDSTMDIGSNKIQDDGLEGYGNSPYAMAISPTCSSPQVVQHQGKEEMVLPMETSTGVFSEENPASEALLVTIGDSIPADEVSVPIFPSPSSGKLLFCGRRREMEDTAALVPSFLNLANGGNGGGETEPMSESVPNIHFFGVYDGHGGSQASNYCRDRLHYLVAEEITKALGPGGCTGGLSEWNFDWDGVLKAAFSKMDVEVGGVCPNAVQQDNDGFGSGCLCCEDAIAPENVGTTAVVAIISPYQITVANCGDSRAVLARGTRAMPMSRDHKPEVEAETNRIEAAGGRVICWDGYRVGGLLALSRALGDRYLKRYVISEPEVTCIARAEDDGCLILATDGLWDVVSNEVACEVARRSLVALRREYAHQLFPPGNDAPCADVAALLVKLAYSRGSKDNISVVVVDLKSR